MAQVVVVGAGPTGITAAIMLARRGIRCLVLERFAQVYPLPRAVHFDDEVFRILAGLGVAGEVRAISRPATGMRLVDARLRVLAEFTRDPGGGVHGHPQSNMVDQPDLERVLRERLASLPLAELRGGVEAYAVEQVPGGPAPVRVRYRESEERGEEHEVWADAVLGCDGANSTVRDLIGSRMVDLGFEQRWLVVDVHSPRPLGGYGGVQQVCDHDRAATFMMVTPGRYRWEFRTDDGDLDDERLHELIRPWLGDVEPHELTVLRRTAYTFRGAVADRWRDRRVFLLGDACHLTPPFIGQGMCAGIRDAANLTWKLALVLTGRAGDALLGTYETERRPYARHVIRMAMLVGWLMTGGSARTARLRRAALRAVARLPGAERKALDVAWPALRAGPLVSRAGRAAGRLCPQPEVLTPHGRRGLDEVLGDGFAIVTRGPGAVDEFFEALGTRLVRLGDPTTGGVSDVDGTLTALLDRAGAGALLVRPDRIVAAESDRPDLRAWRDLLEFAGITAPA